MGALTVVALLIAGCGASAPLSLPSPSPSPSSSPSAKAAPTGRVTVAYPDEPGAWFVPEGDDPAATDWTSIWGLPLYRIGPGGHLRRGLVDEVVETGPATEGWQVTFTTRTGDWSDGSPVVAADVVATLQALRERLAAELAPLTDAVAVDDHTVRLTFDRAYARWPYLLSGARSVLPASVLSSGGLDAFHDDLPVTGGRFRLAEHEPGLGATFVAHETSPLGAPQLAEVRTLVTPDYETALGLLEDDEVQVALGYLAVDPGRRTEGLEGVETAAPLGGTWVALDWHPDGVLGGDAQQGLRRSVAAAANLTPFIDGILDVYGESASTVLPGVSTTREVPVTPNLSSVERPVLTIPEGQEITSLTARALERAMRAAGSGLDLYAVATPEFVEAARQRTDGALRVMRTGPRPSLLTLTGISDPLLQMADAAPTRDHPEVLRALDAVTDDASMVPLYRVGVTHAWRDVGGLRASSWPGLALWDVGEWRRGDGP